MGVEAAKRALRRRMAALPVEPAAAAAAERVHAHLLGEAAFADASRVALYAALADEVATRPLFEALARDGRPCLLPRVCDGGRLEFARVERWDELVRGRYGVAEPPAAASAVALGAADWVLVPGVAFDLAGRRLGRGGGYYDRSFPADAAAPPLLVGVTREARIVDCVPHDSHDRVMDAIVTERAFRWAWGDRR